MTAAGISANMYITKLNSAGNFVWAKAMRGTVVTGWSIAVDVSGSGAVYTTGDFSGTVDFDPGPGVYNVTGGGLFISKLDTAGNFVWARASGGTGYALGYAVAIDPAGRGAVYTTGDFSGTVDFDPGAGVYNLSSISAALGDIFIAKFDSSGNFEWAKQMGGTGYDEGLSIAIDAAGSGNVYTVGAFHGTADFDPGTGTFNQTSAGGWDMFITKLDSSGNFAWAKATGGTGNYDLCFSIAPDPAGSGDVYTTGYFDGTVDFDPGTGTYNLSSAGSEDIFISKLDSAGNLIWAKAMGGTGQDVGQSIAFHAAGGGAVFTTGYFSGTVDFDPGTGVFNLTSSGSEDIFVSKLDSAGNFTWAKATGGTGGDYGQSIALDSSGKVHLAGAFRSSPIQFGSTTLTNPGSGYADIFIAHLDTTIISGSNEMETSNRGILLFPNPATAYINILIGNNHKNVEITIVDVSGNIMYKAPATEMQKIKLSIRDFAEGVYFVHIHSGDFFNTSKFIVMK